jgi:hypothetical protein
VVQIAPGFPERRMDRPGGGGRLHAAGTV